MAVLTIAQVRKWLRYEDDDASNEFPLDIVLEAGQRYIENQTGHLLGQREVVETPAAFPSGYYDLRYGPYEADSLEIVYMDGGAETPFTDFSAFTVNGRARVTTSSEWPSASTGITLTYTAGYVSVDDVPADLLHALCVYAGMSDEDRAAPGSAGWAAIDHLLQFYKLPVLR